MLTSKRFNLQLGRVALWVIVVFGVGHLWAQQASAARRAGATKHYFKVVDVQGDVAEETRKLAQEMLQKELASRDAFVADLGVDVTGAVLRSRGMRGFDVSLRFESVTKEVKEAKPGRRGKQLVLGVHITIFGAEIPTQKLAFSGDGQSTQIVEVDERRIDKEAQLLMGEVLADAIRQAVDQAVLKLTLPANGPLDESRKKRTKSAKAKTG